MECNKNSMTIIIIGIEQDLSYTRGHNMPNQSLADP